MPATSAPAVHDETTTTTARTWWWGFALYAVVSAVHVIALALDAGAVSAPSKLALMPALLLAVIWAARGARWRLPHGFLLAAIVLSWLGDGAGTFFPFLSDELPAMLLCFGLAHVAYIVLFLRYLAVRRVPGWALVYVAWWVALTTVLWPHLGGLAVAVAVYGLVLGGTAASSTRCHPLVIWGGALFLASDSILAFRIFLPDAMPDWTSPAVMLAYCAGQGLIAVGAVVSLRGRTA